MSCGELAEDRCLEAIKPFRDQIEFREVRNVCPQIEALNQMISVVETEYFIPLDADIVLHFDAWDRIGNAYRKHFRNPAWHSILFPLWDTLTERRILALKLMRTKIMKEHLFSNSCTPDVEHYKRLTEAGFTCIHDYLRQKPIGDHVVAGLHFCYHKYRDVYQTYRSHNFEWDSGAFIGGTDLRERAKAHFDFFMTKWLKTENDDYLACIAGMTDGIISPIENISKNLGKEPTIKLEQALDEFYRWYSRSDRMYYPEGVLY